MTGGNEDDKGSLSAPVTYNHHVDTRSPPHLLDQIVLVDDASTMDHVKDELDLYMKQYPKVIIIAT